MDLNDEEMADLAQALWLSEQTRSSQAEQRERSACAAPCAAAADDDDDEDLQRAILLSSQAAMGGPSGDFSASAEDPMATEREFVRQQQQRQLERVTHPDEALGEAARAESDHRAPFAPAPAERAAAGSSHVNALASSPGTSTPSALSREGAALSREGAAFLETAHLEPSLAPLGTSGEAADGLFICLDSAQKVSALSSER